MKKFYLLITVSFFLLFVESKAQVGIGTPTPDPSAQLEVTSTTKGFLLPRMTEQQRNAIANPAVGLLVFQTDGDVGLYYYDGRNWSALSTMNSHSRVTTVAGSGSPGSVNATGAAASFNYPFGVTTDEAGNIYVADQQNNKIRKITPDGTVTTFAGSGSRGSTDGSSDRASFNQPAGIVFGDYGYMYVADMGNHTIREIDPDGVVRTIAGVPGSPGSNDQTDRYAAEAKFNSPTGVAVYAGAVLVADSKNNKIRKIVAGSVSTVAGTGRDGKTDGTGDVAQFNDPTGVTLDAAGNIYVADQGNHLIRKITSTYTNAAVTYTVSTFAGTGQPGATDGSNSNASFNQPTGITTDNNGNLYVADLGNHKIRKVSRFENQVSTVAGSGASGSVDASSGIYSSFNSPSGVALGSGFLYVADKNNHKIRRVNMQ